ncbi:MAG: DUF4956 domain-containing protein [Clostridia bacterium]|nr:DUF4956 domain-containing protein [Clostridia bacterium]
MSFSDIFKKSFLEGFSGDDINIYTAVISMLITCAIALYIFFIYRVVTRKTFYSKTFNISLAAISIITSSVILTIQSSIVVSLGMVGALSIVRFRTAIKDPMDLVFLFWSIVVGIICGVGLAEIAILLSIVITILIFVLNKLPVAKAPLMLVINSNDLNAENAILEVVGKYAKHYTVKSRNMTQSSLDMIVELRTAAGSELLKEILALNGINTASLLSHDGEVTF